MNRPDCANLQLECIKQKINSGRLNVNLGAHRKSPVELITLEVTTRLEFRKEVLKRLY